jgi:hypothetical protein
VSASLGNVFSSEVQPLGEKSAITEDEKIFQYFPLKKFTILSVKTSFPSKIAHICSGVMIH